MSRTKRLAYWLLVAVALGVVILVRWLYELKIGGVP